MLSTQEKRQQRNTHQKAVVLQAVLESGNHPSADVLYEKVRQVIPRISLGTVYRNLHKLAEEGRIRQMYLRDRTAHYDPMVAEHDHFVCQQCGMIENLIQRGRISLRVPSLRQQGYRIYSHTIVVYGLCRNCKGKRELPSREGRKWA